MKTWTIYKGFMYITASSKIYTKHKISFVKYDLPVFLRWCAFSY